MIVRDDVPAAPDWTVNPATCRRCHNAWHADDCPTLDLPAGAVLADN